MLPLTFASIGEEHTIKKVGGGAETKRHLENLGFVTGSGVSVVNSIGGNIIVRVKDARVAISEEMAARIMI